MNERIDLTSWGGILFSGSAEAFASVEIKDGTYEVLFGMKKILYMRVINSKYLSQTESICVCLNAAISSRQNKTPPYFSGIEEFPILWVVASFLFRTPPHISKVLI